jgi:nitrite reductase/ring-hydroxylating ferredoxin subunit
MSDSGTWHAAAALSEIPEDEALGVDIVGQSVAIYRRGDQFYATGNVCTHAQQLLSDGLLEGCEIECPLHLGRFDIRTGEALTSPVEVDIPTYPVRVAGDRLEVYLPE